MLRARLKLLFLDLGHRPFSSCEQEGPIKSISSKKMDFQAKLCSCSSPVCSGRGAGGPISLKHICSWMLMKGEHRLWRAFSRVLVAVCASFRPGTAILCHAACSPAYSRNTQMKFQLGAVFLSCRGASWRVHPAGHGQSVCAGPTYQKPCPK